MKDWKHQCTVNGAEVMLQSISLIHFIGLCWNNDLSIVVKYKA